VPLTVRQAKGSIPMKYRIIDGKNRYIAARQAGLTEIPAELTELLKEYKIWQDGEKIKWGDKWIETNKLFTKENGEPIFPETPSQWFSRFIKRHNLPPLTFHQLRHS
jgi:integrase